MLGAGSHRRSWGWCVLSAAPLPGTCRPARSQLPGSVVCRVSVTFHPSSCCRLPVPFSHLPVIYQATYLDSSHWPFCHFSLNISIIHPFPKNYGDTTLAAISFTRTLRPSAPEFTLSLTKSWSAHRSKASGGCWVEKRVCGACSPAASARGPGLPNPLLGGPL